MYKCITLFAVLFFSSCKDLLDKGMPLTADKKEKEKPKRVREIPKRTYSGWLTAGTGKMNFHYPKNWYLYKVESEELTRYLLSDTADTTSHFYPMEIYEFDNHNQPFERFSEVPHQYFEQATDGRRANLYNQVQTTFASRPAVVYEFRKDDYRILVTTVDGESKFYMFVEYPFEKVYQTEEDILKSIEIASN